MFPLANTRKRHYEALGQDAYYEEVMPWLESLFERYLQDEDEHYLLAVNEAVCNAARYARAGYENVRIYVDIEIAPETLSTTVTADTIPFDVLGLYRKMIAIGKDASVASEDWGDYTGSSDKSRGFWMMLTPCRHVDIDINGKSVTLVADRPFSTERLCKTICKLVGRLRIVRGKDVLDAEGKKIPKKNGLGEVEEKDDPKDFVD